MVRGSELGSANVGLGSDERARLQFLLMTSNLKHLHFVQQVMSGRLKANG
jgi:hypothetical protein